LGNREAGEKFLGMKAKFGGERENLGADRPTIPLILVKYRGRSA
jgi:hypothetical protein